MTPTELQQAYENHADAVFRFAFRITGSVAVAEDLAHDCFVALGRGSAAYNPEKGSLRVFLLGVTRRLAARLWRTESRLDPLGEDGRFVEPTSLETLEIQDAVAACVGALPPLQREVLVLAEYEGLTLREIAQAVETEVGTVKARLHRARENLRKTLAPFAPARRNPTA
ncbi:MAG: sigma-70 family RNA polymerase sigma factor [Acidobacteria bacterium]|nr:sigma-70 family RNA polymerase sigma factor [Acidobacteriota bacterium]